MIGREIERCKDKEKEKEKEKHVEVILARVLVSSNVMNNERDAPFPFISRLVAWMRVETRLLASQSR